MYNAEILALSQNAESDAIGELPTFNSVKDTIYGEKKRLRPPLQPTSPLQTTTERRTMASHSAEHRILGFASPVGLKLLAQATDIFLDGTFFITPSLFDQLVTVHLCVSGKFVPCAYLLLPGRSTAICASALSLSNAACTSAGQPAPLSALFFYRF